MSDIYSMRWTTPLYGYGLVYHVSVIVLLDMSKAFDSIRHDLLINKLYKLGVSFAACSWFLSYLSQRMQVVKIEDFLSELLPLKAGVPQGSILGPVLFTLYVNDLLQVPKRCRALGYVDDTKIFMEPPSSQLPEAVTAVNQDLRDISSWCCAHSLLINPDKTKHIFVGVPQLTRSISTSPPVMLLGKEVKPSIVDLGVHIDCHLNYNEHIAKTVSTCTYMFRRVNRIKHLLDSKTLVFLMNAFIFSSLIYYCSTVWSNTTKENIKKLQLIQNFACRIVLGLKKYDHITEGLKSLNWLNVNDRLLVNNLLMVHKCIHNLIPSYLTGKFTQRSKIHGRNTRGSGELDLPFCRLKTGQRSFAFQEQSCVTTSKTRLSKLPMLKSLGLKSVITVFVKCVVPENIHSPPWMVLPIIPPHPSEFPFQRGHV